MYFFMLKSIKMKKKIKKYFYYKIINSLEYELQIFTRLTLFTQ